MPAPAGNMLPRSVSRCSAPAPCALIARFHNPRTVENWLGSATERSIFAAILDSMCTIKSRKSKESNRPDPSNSVSGETCRFAENCLFARSQLVSNSMNWSCVICLCISYVWTASRVQGCRETPAISCDALRCDRGDRYLFTRNFFLSQTRQHQLHAIRHSQLVKHAEQVILHGM